MTIWSIRRAFLASEGTRFVPKARVSYRNGSQLNRLSYTGSSNAKKDAILLSISYGFNRAACDALPVRSNQIYAADPGDTYYHRAHDLRDLRGEVGEGVRKGIQIREDDVNLQEFA